MRMACVFETEADAETYQSEALATWLSGKEGTAYAAQTTRWAVPAQRETDGKWWVASCPTKDNSSYTQEEVQEDWFPEPEEYPE